MKSRFKLAKWKYGIAEVQKYFVDLQAYGKPEEEELLKRKTFYDYVEDLIDEIKKSKKQKEIKTIEDKYINNNNEINKFGVVFKKEKDKNESDNNNVLNTVDNTTNMKIELSDILEKIKLRRKKEKQKRHIVDNILFRSDMRRKAINDSTNKINNKKKILNKSKEKDKTIDSVENDDKND